MLRRKIIAKAVNARDIRLFGWIFKCLSWVFIIFNNNVYKNIDGITAANRIN